MKPIKRVSLLWGVLLVSLTLVSGCFSANNTVPQAPTNQLIKGPFTIGPEWQTITLDKALETVPHIQDLQLLLNVDNYKKVNGIGKSDFDIVGSSYEQASTGKIIKPELILIDNQSREFRATISSLGYREIDNTLYNLLSFGTNSDKGVFYFPKNTKFISLKLRSNLKLQVEGLYWVAPYYFRNPSKKWEDAKPSKILDIK
jgi:hypothetical protein